MLYDRPVRGRALHALLRPHPIESILTMLNRSEAALQLQALYDGQYVDAHFTRSFYKHMLGQVSCIGTAIRDLGYLKTRTCMPPTRQTHGADA